MAYYASPIDSINKDPRNNPITSDKDDFSQSFAQLQYVHNTSKNLILTNTLYYNRLDGKFDVFGDYIQLGSNFIGFMSNYLFKINNLKINSGFHLNSYERVHSGSDDYSDSIKHPYINKGLKHEGSVYTKFNYDVNKFNLFADLQLRNVDFTYDGDKSMPVQKWLFLNPRCGVTYTISKNENTYFSVGKTDREPTRTNMFGGSDNLITLNNIVPESVIDYELGYNLNTDKLKIQSNLFYMNFKNEITLAGAVTSNSLPSTTTVARSFRTGLESDLSYKINDKFTIDNTASLLYSKFYMNDNEISRVPLYSPLLMMSQDVVYTNGSLMINLCGQVSTEGYIDLTNKNTTPSYFLLNLTVSYQCTKNVQITVRGNNLTNTRYYSGGYVDVDNQNSYFIGAPINFYTTLSVKL
jgi:iron complex outermembrane receptor protein